ncbi:MAG: shikimate dehydrogenase [Clostridia bacterium]|nr:shikimate dehydrogenase [Clostridia bacterium]
MIVDKRVSGKTRIMGVLGNPVEHSISPQLHNTLSTRLGIDTVYVPFRVEKADLDNAVKGLKALNVLGFNVTIPYKKDIMKFIDDNTKEALLMGAVNTVKNIDGRLYGYNTDAEGFSRSFKEESGATFKGKNILIIGAGGVSRAIAVKTAIEGAKHISLVNRTISKALDIAGIIENNYETGIRCLDSEDKKYKDAFSEADIVINTTSVGMYPEIEGCPVDKKINFMSHQIIYDVIYNPAKSKLLKKAEKSGCKAMNGLGMLFYQGIYAYEIWTGIKLSEDIIKEIYKSFVNILKN